MYVAVKGGEKAIDNAHGLLAKRRRGNKDIAQLGVDQIQEQLSLAVDRVMTEGSLYDPELAALALKQAMGDCVEAIFLLRAYRTTLPRFGYSEPVDTRNMRLQRRISATYKDIPGGQLLGPTYDYTHRLLDFKLLADGEPYIDNLPSSSDIDLPAEELHCPKVMDLLHAEGLLQNTTEQVTVGDITREPIAYPCKRSEWLQTLVRADEGFLLSLGYSTQRGYGRTHPFAGEIRMGYVEITMAIDELDFSVSLGEICITECEMINQFSGNQQQPPQFTQGYGISFGFCERKTMAMALVDRSLQSKSLGESTDSPAAQEEFVLSHCDNVEASGFVSHLKLPHYVDFQSELALIRKLREEFFSKQTESDITTTLTSKAGDRSE